jgi:amino acid adenylation domain-containing protein
MCIHSLVDEQCRRHPTASALEFEGQTWTYDRLTRAANRLARHLLRQGVRPDELVGVCLQRSPALVLSMLGVLKAGAAYLPLDPAYPRQRLANMLEDAQVRVLLTERALLNDLPAHGAQVICLDQPELAANESEDAPDAPVAAENLAYAIFTSGSTGRPKAARLTHGGLCNMVRAQQDGFEMSPRSRVLQLSSLSFDASVSEIFVTLASGATLVLADARRLTPGPELAQTLRELEISVATIPPSVLALIGEVDLPDLRTLIVAGERCTADLASRWSIGRRFINAYGPTETTVCATMHLCPQGPQPAPPIGRPLPGYRLHLLDVDGRPVAQGEAGELFIGGPGVARDYLNRPELTAERFVADAFSGIPGARLYRTGDRVRMREDGVYEFLGRLDQQVKIRGVRIELEEIAAAVEAHPAVRRAVVLVEEDAEGGKRLAAYAVRRPDRQVTPRELRDTLQQQLPAAMMPGVVAVLDELPLTPNGKADRAALAAAAAAQSRDDRPRIAPRDSLEHQLAAVWETQLGQSPIGVTENFFELGGDSLGALELLARIERQCGYDVPLHKLMHGPTIEQLATAVRQQASPDTWSPLVTLVATGSRRPFFCMHPGGGNVLCYRELCKELGSDRPVYGLQAPGIDGVRPPLDSVEAMATEYLRAIRGVQPRGPYLLGGWSFGAAVAYEMACQLRDQGEEIALLAAIDAGIVYLFGVLAAVFPNDEMGLLGLQGLPSDEQVAMFAERTSVAQLIPPGASPNQGRRIYDVFVSNTNAMMDFRPRPYDGKLTLFRAEEKFVKSRRGPAAEWRELCRQVDEHIVPGNHLTCIQPPHVRSLAESLRRLLDNTDETDTVIAPRSSWNLQQSQATAP